MKTLLETHTLAVGYSSTAKPLFSGLNLSLAEGALVCFMGPNGVGKSTLIRTLAGLQSPLDGKVVLPGTNNAPLHRHVAVVLTERVNAMYMTVRDLVTFGRYPYLDWNIRLRPEDQQRIDDALQRIHITHLANHKLHALSDGQLQMAMIARALAQDTPVLLLDEPTAHLDLNNRVEIMRLLQKLAHTDNKAILVSTHELDLALQTADRIWLAGHGQTITEGMPEDLVLNGAFDEIFQFKGFDLKSGKVLHEPLRGQTICLNGDGPFYWWTKNALERNGFGVTAEQTAWEVVITGAGQWQVRKEKDHETFNTLYDVLLFLQRPA